MSKQHSNTSRKQYFAFDDVEPAGDGWLWLFAAALLGLMLAISLNQSVWDAAVRWFAQVVG